MMHFAVSSVYTLYAHRLMNSMLGCFLNCNMQIRRSAATYLAISRVSSALQMNVMIPAGPKGLQGTRQPSRELNDLRLGTNETCKPTIWRQKVARQVLTGLRPSVLHRNGAQTPTDTRTHPLCAATPIVSSSSYCTPDLSVATARPKSPSSQALGKSQYAASITRDCCNVTWKDTNS